MKFATYNVQYGIGRDGKFDLDRIMQSLEGADIIALQEVTRNFMRNGGADMIAELSERLNTYFHAFGPAMDIDFGMLDDSGKPANKRLQFGNMIFSRWPIVSSRNILLPRTRRINRANLQRAALEALIMAPSGPFRVYSVHVDHVSLEERSLQINYLKERLYAYPMEGGAITGSVEYGFPELPCPSEFVVMGDFNMVQASPEYVLMTGAIDYAEGRQIVAHHPVDVFTLAGGVPEGATSWVDTKKPETNRLIDYAFVESSLAARVEKVWIDAEAEGSDHQPVWFEMK